MDVAQHTLMGPSSRFSLASCICRTLGALAEKCHAFAKALHYKEVEFAQTPETAVEALISINNQLRQPEAAIGILAVAQNDLHMELKVSAVCHSFVGLFASACRSHIMVSVDLSALALNFLLWGPKYFCRLCSF